MVAFPTHSPIVVRTYAGSSRYDLSTYLGRVKHFWGLVNPLKSVFASQEELNADIALIQRWKVEKAAGLPHSVTDDERLWNAKERLAAVYHPDTGEKIPLPLRMAMFMPVNLPITAGMLLSPPVRASILGSCLPKSLACYFHASFQADLRHAIGRPCLARGPHFASPTCACLIVSQGVMQLVFQTINQTYNAGFNYANRNATVPVDMTDVLASYLVATGTAVAAAHGLGKVVANLQNKMGGVPTLKVKLLSRGLPWLAVATAGSMNVLAMRYREAM